MIYVIDDTDVKCMTASGFRNRYGFSYKECLFDPDECADTLVCFHRLEDVEAFIHEERRLGNIDKMEYLDMLWGLDELR